jgi:hypothetical protein
MVQINVYPVIRRLRFRVDKLQKNRKKLFSSAAEKYCKKKFRGERILLDQKLDKNYHFSFSE